VIHVVIEPENPEYLDRPVTVKPGREVLLGRSNRSDITLSHPEVSRLHCKIVNDGKECKVLDMGSTNGIFVNGHRVANQVLTDRDKLEICNIPFSIRIREAGISKDSSVHFIEVPSQREMKKSRSYHPTRIMDDILAASRGADLAKAHADLSFITKIANMIVETEQIEDQFKKAIKTIVEFFNADRGSILIIDRATKKIRPEEVYAAGGTKDGEVSISRTIVHEVIEKGHSVLTTDASGDSRFKASDSVVGLNITSVMCVPLEGRHGIIGTIYIDTIRDVQTFSEENLKVLSAVGYQIGAALQQAWLEQDLRSSKKGLEEYSRRLEFKVNERTAHLSRMIEKLKESDQLKSQFLANMSHELRTPLNAIVGFASLIQDRVYGEITVKQDDAIDKIKENAGHLLELIKNVLDISKIDAGRMPLFLETFKPRSVIKKVIGGSSPLLKTGVEFKMELDKSIRDVYNDKGKYRQIVQNLCANAIKFTHEGGITVITEADSENETFITRIRDTGIGIPEKQLNMIFDEFSQADGSATREYEGSGLGLAICQRLVNLMMGNISVTSQVGEGTEFSVELPLDIRKVVEEGKEISMQEKEQENR